VVLVLPVLVFVLEKIVELRVLFKCVGPNGGHDGALPPGFWRSAFPKDSLRSAELSSNSGEEVGVVVGRMLHVSVGRTNYVPAA
jgi:hypothetical protein